jgi:hypothetical protein
MSEGLLDDPATFGLGEVDPIGQWVGATPQRMVQQWHQEWAGTTSTLFAPDVGRVRQPMHDRRNVARSGSAQHRHPHWWPCRQQLGRPRDVPHHLLNHTIRFRGVRCDGCPAYRTCVRSLGCSDEAVPVHDVPTWLRPWVSAKPADEWI